MRFWAGLFFAGVALNVIIGLAAWPSVLSGHLTDPDSYMRLARILDGVREGHLTNYVPGDGPAPGVLVEWSRLMDAALWALAAPLAPFLGWRHALLAAGAASGPLIAGLLVVALAFVAEPFVARRFLWLLMPATILLPALSNYAGPGIVTHHVLVLVLLALTAGCVVRAGRFDTGWNFLAGAAGGLAIWLTPETMPYVLLAFGLLFLRWLLAPAGAGIAACGAGFIDILGFGFAIDPPAGGYGVPETDRLSIVFVALGLAVFCTGILLWRLERLPGAWRRRLAGLAGAILFLACWLTLFPKTALGPYGLMSPADAKLFFGVIGEMQPAAPNPSSFAALWPGFLGVLIAASLCVTGRDPAWWYGLAALAVTLALGVRFLRFAPVPAAAGAVLTVLAIQKLSARFADQPSFAAMARILLIAALLIGPFAPAWARHRAMSAATPAASCDLAPFAPALAAAAGQTVLADVNETPELLWRSQVLTVGSLYHHGVAGFLAARAAWRAPGSGPQPPQIAATGAQYVLFCAGAGRTLLVADLPKTTIWDALLRNRPPAWLRQIAADPATGWRLYRIADDQKASSYFFEKK